jgi:hypothetical protein
LQRGPLVSRATRRFPPLEPSSGARPTRTIPSGELCHYLEERLAAALEWYRGCDVCDETLANVKGELESILEEACRRFGVERMPFILRARFDGADLVVRAISCDVS